MRNVKASPSSDADLRRRAKKRLKAKKPASEPVDPGADPRELLQKLQICQIELEMQNDELRAAQERIEASRSRYEHLYDFSPLSYFSFDPTGIIVAVNLTGASLLGVERGLLIQSQFSTFVDSKSRELFFSHLGSVFKTGTKQTCELLLNTRGRNQVSVLLESIMAEDGDGGIRQCRSAIVDMTARRRVEENFRESEERFRLTFDKSPIGAALVGIDQRITHVNEELCRMLGYTDKEIVGKTLRDVTHPEDIEADLDMLQAMLDGRSDSYEMDKRMLHRNGDIVWGRLSAGVIRDADGWPKYAVRMIQDLTHFRQSECWHSLASQILKNLNDPTPMADSINAVLAAIVRETGFDAVGIRLRKGDDFPYFAQNGFSGDFLHSENSLIFRDGSGDICRDENGRIRLECTCGLVMSGATPAGSPFFTEGGSFWTNDTLPLLTLPAKQDPRLQPRNNCIHQGYLSVALIPIRADQEIVGLLQLNDRRKDRFTLGMIHLLEGIAASIGVALIRKQTEMALEARTAELEKVNKELESFSYSVSHDLRAPLRAIEGYIRMITREQRDRFDDQAMHRFSQIRDNTRIMGKLIDDILAFSRLGRQEIVATRIDMESLAKEVWEELQTINPDRAMILKIDQPPPGMGDRALIRQVLSNLLSNAVKYTANRDVALVEVGGHSEDSENVYYVKDNGAGFDMAYYHKLFGVFQRLHRAEEYEGTGIGLAIVQRIVNRHGGRVWAEGQVNIGATFHFTLPRRRE